MTTDRENNPNHLPWEWEYRPNRGCVVYDCRGKEVCSTYKEKRAAFIVESANRLYPSNSTRVLFAVADDFGGEEHFFPDLFRANAGKTPDYIDVDGVKFVPENTPPTTEVQR